MDRHAADYAHHAVSLTMPISHPHYLRKLLHPVFDQNMPEGDRREAIARAAQMMSAGN